jgi:transposase, IS30 family
MKKTHQHLKLEERALIQNMLEQCYKSMVVFLVLVCSRSRISRELSRNNYTAPSILHPLGLPFHADVYHCVGANQRARAISFKPRLPWRMIPGTALRDCVLNGLSKVTYSEQISDLLFRCKSESIHISHESVYSTTNAMPRGELRIEVIGLLRKSLKTHRPCTQGFNMRGTAANMASDFKRPLEIYERFELGHCEENLINGVSVRSKVGTLVEHTALLTVIAHMQDDILL